MSVKQISWEQWDRVIFQVGCLAGRPYWGSPLRLRYMPSHSYSDLPLRVIYHNREGMSSVIVSLWTCAMQCSDTDFHPVFRRESPSMDCSALTCIWPLIKMELETGKKVAEQCVLKLTARGALPRASVLLIHIQVLIALRQGVSFSSMLSFQRSLLLMHFGGGFLGESHSSVTCLLQSDCSNEA